MRIVTVFQFGFWFGYVLNRDRRIMHGTLPWHSEFQARQKAGDWLLKQQGRAA